MNVTTANESRRAVRQFDHNDEMTEAEIERLNSLTMLQP